MTKHTQKTQSNLLIYAIIVLPILILTLTCSIILYLIQGNFYKPVDGIALHTLSNILSETEGSVSASVIDNPEAKLTLEVADDDFERSRGLQNRDRLGTNEGMLFIFKEEEDRNFWMFNTRIPLDIAFLNEDKEIINIEYSTTPLNSEITYRSTKPAMYVIETNAGWFKSNNVEPKDVFKF